MARKYLSRIAISGVSLDKNCVLDFINFDFRGQSSGTPRSTLLCGGNSTGKTTLLGIMLNHLQPDESRFVPRLQKKDPGTQKQVHLRDYLKDDGSMAFCVCEWMEEKKTLDLLDNGSWNKLVTVSAMWQDGNDNVKRLFCCFEPDEELNFDTLPPITGTICYHGKVKELNKNKITSMRNGYLGDKNYEWREKLNLLGFRKEIIDILIRYNSIEGGDETILANERNLCSFLLSGGLRNEDLNSAIEQVSNLYLSQGRIICYRSIKSVCTEGIPLLQAALEPATTLAGMNEEFVSINRKGSSIKEWCQQSVDKLYVQIEEVEKGISVCEAKLNQRMDELENASLKLLNLETAYGMKREDNYSRLKQALEAKIAANKTNIRIVNKVFDLLEYRGVVLKLESLRGDREKLRIVRGKAINAGSVLHSLINSEIMANNDCSEKIALAMNRWDERIKQINAVSEKAAGDEALCRQKLADCELSRNELNLKIREMENIRQLSCYQYVREKEPSFIEASILSEKDAMSERLEGILMEFANSIDILSAEKDRIDKTLSSLEKTTGEKKAAFDLYNRELSKLSDQLNRLQGEKEQLHAEITLFPDVGKSFEEINAEKSSLDLILSEKKTDRKNFESIFAKLEECLSLFVKAGLETGQDPELVLKELKEDADKLSAKLEGLRKDKWNLSRYLEGGASDVAAIVNFLHGQGIKAMESISLLESMLPDEASSYLNAFYGILIDACDFEKVDGMILEGISFPVPVFSELPEPDKISVILPANNFAWNRNAVRKKIASLDSEIQILDNELASVIKKTEIVSEICFRWRSLERKDSSELRKEIDALNSEISDIEQNVAEFSRSAPLARKREELLSAFSIKKRNITETEEAAAVLNKDKLETETAIVELKAAILENSELSEKKVCEIAYRQKRVEWQRALLGALSGGQLPEADDFPAVLGVGETVNASLLHDVVSMLKKHSEYRQVVLLCGLENELAKKNKNRKSFIHELEIMDVKKQRRSMIIAAIEKGRQTLKVKQSELMSLNGQLQGKIIAIEDRFRDDFNNERIIAMDPVDKMDIKQAELVWKNALTDLVSIQHICASAQELETKKANLAARLMEDINDKRPFRLIMRILANFGLNTANGFAESKAVRRKLDAKEYALDTAKNHLEKIIERNRLQYLERKDRSAVPQEYADMTISGFLKEMSTAASSKNILLEHKRALERSIVEKKEIKDRLQKEQSIHHLAIRSLKDFMLENPVPLSVDMTELENEVKELKSHRKHLGAQIQRQIPEVRVKLVEFVKLLNERLSEFKRAINNVDEEKFRDCYNKFMGQRQRFDDMIAGNMDDPMIGAMIKITCDDLLKFENLFEHIMQEEGRRFENTTEQFVMLAKSGYNLFQNLAKTRFPNDMEIFDKYAGQQVMKIRLSGKNSGDWRQKTMAALDRAIMADTKPDTVDRICEIVLQIILDINDVPQLGIEVMNFDKSVSNRYVEIGSKSTSGMQAKMVAFMASVAGIKSILDERDKMSVGANDILGGLGVLFGDNLFASSDSCNMNYVSAFLSMCGFQCVFFSPVQDGKLDGLYSNYYYLSKQEETNRVRAVRNARKIDNAGQTGELSCAAQKKQD